MRKKKNKSMTPKAEELILKELNKLDSNEAGQIAILNQSIMNSWQGVFPLKDKSKLTMEEALAQMKIEE